MTDRKNIQSNSKAVIIADDEDKNTNNRVKDKYGREIDPSYAIFLSHINKITVRGKGTTNLTATTPNCKELLNQMNNYLQDLDSMEMNLLTKHASMETMSR